MNVLHPTRTIRPIAEHNFKVNHFDREHPLTKQCGFKMPTFNWEILKTCMGTHDFQNHQKSSKIINPALMKHGRFLRMYGPKRLIHHF
jgi:hypothetical protein